jgi:hypothetical protein
MTLSSKNDRPAFASNRFEAGQEGRAGGADDGRAARGAEGNAVKPLISMREALYDRAIFDAGDPSWLAWNVLSIAGMGEPLTDEERPLFTQLTGREREPLERVEELIARKGRRSGGTSAMARLLAYLCCLCVWDDDLDRGEVGIGLFLASTSEQATVAFTRASGIIDASPILRSMVVKTTQDTITLSNRTELVVLPASAKSLRGISCVGICADEIAWWMVDGANSDSEILNAIRPSLATTNGMLIIGSSPYRPEGELYQLDTKYFGPDGDPKILVSRATSRETNPTLPQSVIDRAMLRDSLKARCEHLCEYRTDVSDYVPRELILSAVDQGVISRLPNPAHRYVCFADASSGLSHNTGGGKNSKGGDAFAAAIGHAEGDKKIVIDYVFERKPPFNASAVVAEISSIATGYGIREIVSDRFSSGFMSAELQRSNMVWKPSDHNKSELYAITLPVLTSGSLRIPDVSSVVDQFCLLERKPGANGRDRIDARGGRSEDSANAIAGVVALLAAPLSGAASFLEFMRRQVEEPGRHNIDFDDIRAAGPEFGFNFGGQPEPLIAIELPPIIAAENSHVNVAGKSYAPRYRENRAFVEMPRKHAIQLFQEMPAWREYNIALVSDLKETL